MTYLRRLVVCIGVIFGIAIPRVAAAADFHPEVAAVLEDLTPAERELLSAAARVDPRGTCTRDSCAILDRIDPKWPQKLREIVGRLAGFGDWKAAALVHLLDPELVKTDLRKRLSETAEKLAKRLLQEKPVDGCTSARQELLWYLEKARDDAAILRSSMGPPLDASASQCFEKLTSGTSARADFRDHNLLAIVVDDDEAIRLHVTVLGVEPEFFEVREFIPFRNYRVALVPIRQGARITTRLSMPGRMLPEIRTWSVKDPVPYERRVRGTRCVEWTIAPYSDADRVVLFDGEPIKQRSIAVPEVDDEKDEIQVHELRVVDSGSPNRVIASASIPASSIPRTGCAQVKLDLTPIDERQDIAILQASADPSCLGAGVDSQRVRGRVERFLRVSGRRPKDTKSWSESVTGYSELVAQLHTLGASAVGASRGRLANPSLLGSGAAEFVRHGFGGLLSVNLTCTPNEQGWDFAVHTSTLNLRKLVQERDDVAGLNLDDVTRSELEVVTGSSFLDSAFIASLSRAFNEPYVRFESAPERRNFYERLGERVRVYVPSSRSDSAGAPSNDYIDDEYTVRLSAHRFEDEEVAFHVCSAVEGAQRVRGSQRPPDWWSAAMDAGATEASMVVRPRAGSEAAYELTWQPHAPGRYLVRLQMGRDRDAPLRGETTSFRCVDAVDSRARFSFDMSYAVNTLDVVPGARVESLQYAQFMLSFSRATSTYGNLFLGIGFGYAAAIHSLPAPPSWDLVGPGGSAVPYAANGQLDLTWTRHSLLLGPRVEYRIPAPLCALRWISCGRIPRMFGLVGRVMPIMIDGGIVEESAVPPQLHQFTRGTRGVELKASSFLQAGITGQLDPQKGLYALGTLGMLSWSDYVLGGQDQRAKQSTIAYDTAMTFGIVVGAEYDL